jgi:hypothetical protein
VKTTSKNKTFFIILPSLSECVFYFKGCVQSCRYIYLQIERLLNAFLQIRPNGLL